MIDNGIHTENRGNINIHLYPKKYNTFQSKETAFLSEKVSNATMIST